MKKAEGRRQKAEGRRKNCLCIVNDQTLCVYKPQIIFSTLIDTVVYSSRHRKDNFNIVK
ncbi:MAG: hypothetical protein F6K01_00640 [Okeania sp. SIO1I7]|nr:hypothetical protein [Okeania sp. SIO1I7]